MIEDERLSAAIELFLGIDIAGFFDGAQQAPTEIRRYQVPGSAKHRNAGERWRCFHAPQKRRADKHCGRHHPEHQAIDHWVNMTVVQVDLS